MGGKKGFSPGMTFPVESCVLQETALCVALVERESEGGKEMRDRSILTTTIARRANVLFLSPFQFDHKGVARGGKWLNLSRGHTSTSK